MVAHLLLSHMDSSRNKGVIEANKRAFFSHITKMNRKQIRSHDATVIPGYHLETKGRCTRHKSISTKQPGHRSWFASNNGWIYPIKVKTAASQSYNRSPRGTYNPFSYFWHLGIPSCGHLLGHWLHLHTLATYYDHMTIFYDTIIKALCLVFSTFGP